MELADKINEELGRGVTFISGQGYYSQKDLKIIYCIVARNENCQDERNDSYS